MSREIDPMENGDAPENMTIKELEEDIAECDQSINQAHQELEGCKKEIRSVECGGEPETPTLDRMAYLENRRDMLEDKLQGLETRKAGLQKALEEKQFGEPKRFGWGRSD